MYKKCAFTLLFYIKIITLLNQATHPLMGKLAIILCFILSVFPADANENRRHIHVVKRGSKKSHRGNTVAKIWIEQNGEKQIEVAWSELSSDDEAVIIEFIDEHWELLNKNIDAVFAGKKIRIMTVDAQKQNKGRRK